MRKPHRMGFMTLVLLVAVGLFPGPGGGAMLKLSLEQLTAEANTIVLATVVRQMSAWDTQHTAIYTDVTVAVEHIITGAPRAEVTFQVAGGTVGDIGMRTSNDPVFQDGERVIVFLNTDGIPARLVGLYQGKYTVQDGKVWRDGLAVDMADFIRAIRAARQ